MNRRRVGVGLILVGVIGAVLLGVVGSVLQRRAITSFGRANVGCISSFQFDRVGTYFVFVETGEARVVDPKCPPSESGDALDVQVSAERTEVRLIDDPNVQYESGAVKARSIRRFEITASGLYTVTVTGPDAGQVIAIGSDPRLVRGPWLTAAGVLAAVGLFGGIALVVLSRRRTDRSDAETVQPEATGTDDAPPYLPTGAVEEARRRRAFADARQPVTDGARRPAAGSAPGPKSQNQGGSPGATAPPKRPARVAPPVVSEGSTSRGDTAGRARPEGASDEPRSTPRAPRSAQTVGDVIGPTRRPQSNESGDADRMGDSASRRGYRSASEDAARTPNTFGDLLDELERRPNRPVSGGPASARQRDEYPSRRDRSAPRRRDQRSPRRDFARYDDDRYLDDAHDRVEPDRYLDDEPDDDVLEGDGGASLRRSPRSSRRPVRGQGPAANDRRVRRYSSGTRSRRVIDTGDEGGGARGVRSGRVGSFDEAAAKRRVPRPRRRSSELAPGNGPTEHFDDRSLDDRHRVALPGRRDESARPQREQPPVADQLGDGPAFDDEWDVPSARSQRSDQGGPTAHYAPAPPGEFPPPQLHKPAGVAAVDDDGRDYTGMSYPDDWDTPRPEPQTNPSVKDEWHTGGDTTAGMRWWSPPEGGS